MPRSHPASKQGDPASAALRWWGSFSFGDDDALRWQIGPMKMWIVRREQELCLTQERGSDPFESALTLAESLTLDVESTPESERVRFGFRNPPDTLRLLPALPDRPVVVKPTLPIFIPSGEELTLYISIPLWIRLHAGESSTRMYETAIFQPSDSWFGSPTEEDGCSYALRTRARMSLEKLTPLPQRAVSVVEIHNHAESELALERFRLPSPNLSLFASQDARLWTETVTFERKDDGHSASVDLDRGPIGSIGPTELVVGPRERMDRGLLMRAFGELF